jgi:hypothetical protein
MHSFPPQPQCSEFSLRGDRGLPNAIIGFLLCTCGQSPRAVARGRRRRRAPSDPGRSRQRSHAGATGERRFTIPDFPCHIGGSIGCPDSEQFPPAAALMVPYGAAMPIGSSKKSQLLAYVKLRHLDVFTILSMDKRKVVLDICKTRLYSDPLRQGCDWEFSPQRAASAFRIRQPKGSKCGACSQAKTNPCSDASCREERRS